MTRDLVSSDPRVAKVPYDVNYVWRLRNDDVPHDELDPSLLTDKLTSSIRHNILKHAGGADFVIEKTNASSLRIPFVDAIFPEAVFVHLVRDPVDVIQSAFRRWQEPTNWRYVLKKARSFPLLQAPAYAFRYASDIARKSSGSSVKSWGQIYDGMPDDVARLELFDVCVNQYIRTVETAKRDLRGIDPSRWHRIEYEELVRQPRDVLNGVGSFLGMGESAFANTDVSIVTANNIGKGHRELTEQQVERISELRPAIEADIWAAEE